MAATNTATPSIDTAGLGTMTSSTRPSKMQWLRPIRRSRSHTPSTAASIPSRYQTFFYSNTESKGFNSKATRFSDHLSVKENPGPGAYATQHDTLENISPSFSMKGAGGLAAGKKRFSQARLEKVGPGSYNPQLMSMHRDFNKAPVTSNFHTPIAVRTEAEKPKPAPNTYHVNREYIERNNLITAEAAFKSKTPREASLHTAYTPAPDRYAVLDNLLHPSSCSFKSAFNSKTARNLKKPQKGPGPADYFLLSDDQRKDMRSLPYYRHKHYLCFSAPALPLPPVPPPPGPGHYEIMDKLAMGNERDRSDLSGAVFKSITGRGLSDIETGFNPGPGYYDPVAEVKRSYFYNVHKKWV